MRRIELVLLLHHLQLELLVEWQQAQRALGWQDLSEGQKFVARMSLEQVQVKLLPILDPVRPPGRVGMIRLVTSH